MPLRDMLDRWNSQSLARQFLAAGGLVSLAAMLVVGAFVAKLIEEAVTRNSAAATALYVDSVIAPLLPDMQTTEVLDESVQKALDETLGQGALGKRLVAIRLWRSDGTLLYANEKSMIGRRFPVSADLARAFSGHMVANLDTIDDGDAPGQEDRPLLLEIYNPLLQPWSGKVVGVLEFYEAAQDFQRSLARARTESWLAIFFVVALFFLILSALVFRGSRTIEEQRAALKARIQDLSLALEQNETLRARVERASQRLAALNENHLRQIGADLHDGPAQLIALAALRLDSEALIDGRGGTEARERELGAIKASLDEAMDEIRSICTGLVLPQIDRAELGAIIKRAVQAHEHKTGHGVRVSLSGLSPELTPLARICIYRFVQEALNNASRHAEGAGLEVVEAARGRTIVVSVSDKGPGFDPDRVDHERLGIAGLRERIESLGGTFEVTSGGHGTRIRMILFTEGREQE